MPVAYAIRITRTQLQQHPDWLFVFGDNLAGYGLGGQAKECRGEPNAIGIPTKREPAKHDNAYFSDRDLSVWRAAVSPAFRKIEEALADGKIVVFPAAGIGTGRAELNKRAPAIWRELREWLDETFARN